jgi:hypothetical protein
MKAVTGNSVSAALRSSRGISPPHQAHGEVVPVSAAKRLHEVDGLAAIRPDAVMKGDRQRNLAVPRLAPSFAQVARRLLDRRFEVVHAVKSAQVVEGGSDGNPLLVVRGQRRDRSHEAVDAVRVVAVALDICVVTARVFAPCVEDLVDYGVAHKGIHGLNIPSRTGPVWRPAAAVTLLPNPQGPRRA